MSVRGSSSVIESALRPRATGLCETVHSLALAVWFGALMAGGISAALLFRTMRELEPTLAGFEGFSGEHWKLGAGRIQAGIFFVCDFVQLGAAALAFLTLGIRLLGAGVDRAPRRAATAWRTIGVGAGVVLVASNVMILAPRMDPHLRSYWQLAREGRTPEALAEAERFNSYHPAATRVHGATAVAVLVAMTAGAWSLSRKLRA